MNSSKATFISRKKLSLFIILLLLPFSLVAAPYRVAAVSDDDAFSSLLDDVLTVLSGEVTSPDAIAEYEKKTAEREELEKAEELSSLRRSESFDAIESFGEDDEEITDDDSLVVEIIAPEFSDVEKSFLLQGDEDAFTYLMLRENLDLLIAADAKEDGLMTECTVYANGEEIHRNLYISSDDSSEFDSLLSALFPMLKDDEVIVRVEAPSTVSLSIDGEAVTLIAYTFCYCHGKGGASAQIHISCL